MLHRVGFAILALAMTVSTAMAHGPSGAKALGANGGEIVDVDGGHLEMVVAANELRLFVTDPADAPLPSAGLEARAIIQIGGKQEILQFVPKERNQLTASLVAPLPKNTKIAVSANLSKSGKRVQARFVAK
jgi:hypothetical protein